MSWTSILIGIAIWTAAACAVAFWIGAVRYRRLNREMSLRLQMEPRRRGSLEGDWRSIEDDWRRVGGA